MTDSDRKMDRDLRGLSSLEPARSVWAEVEKHIARQEKTQRRRVAVRYAMPALAASLMLALLVLNTQSRQADYELSTRKTVEYELSIQKTVENAVRNARPQPAFSNLEYDKGRLTLEAILVSAKPRQAEIVPAGKRPDDQKPGEKPKAQNQPEVNEF